jgi:Zn-dependent protease/predicted transcriptional regulator
MTGYRIGTIAGIPIRIHVSFLIALPLIAFGFAGVFRQAAELAGVPAGRIAGGSWIWGLAVALLLFASVLVHELAHSLYALHKGGRVRDIVLLLIGGVSQIEETPRAPRHEAVMALVGPLVSLALGAAFFLAHVVAPADWFAIRFGLFYLAVLNGILGVFNLLPAYPMDGGRILRALLLGRMGTVRATLVAATVGKIFAVAFGILGLLGGNFFLILIAFFVYIGAQGESRGVLVKAAIGHLRVFDLMTPNVAAAPEDLSVREAVELMLRERREALVVMRDGQPVAVVTPADIKKVDPGARAGTTIAAVARPAAALSPDDPASEVLRIMAETDVPQVAVVDGGQLVGTVGRIDVARALELSDLETSLRRRPPRLRPRPG